MKFTPLSSLSENYCTSKGNPFGCFAGVLSRILCSKSLPTHPSSDPIELDSNRHFSKMEERILSDGSATPNVVARLMGLDTMPEISSKSLGFIQRSKSMDSEENREKTEEIQGKTLHRRAKTCVSFRETQGFFELEDDNFFILRFDNRGEIKKKSSNCDNCDVGFKGYKNQRRREKCRRKKQRRNRDEQGKDRAIKGQSDAQSVNSSGGLKKDRGLIFTNEERLSLQMSPIFEVSKQSYNLSPLKDKNVGKKEEFDGNKKRKKKKNFLGESKDDEMDLENLSPVSVLDHNTEFISDLNVTTSEEDARLEVCGSVSTNNASESSQNNERERDGNIERHVALKRREYKKHENVEMLRKVCKLAEIDVKNSNNWKYRRILRCDELEDTATDFGQGIFDQLVNEMLDQLVGFES